MDLAVGLGAAQLKVGSFARSERMAKWNECTRPEEAYDAEMRFVRSWPLRETWWGKHAARAHAGPIGMQGDQTAFPRHVSYLAAVDTRSGEVRRRHLTASLLVCSGEN